MITTTFEKKIDDIQSQLDIVSREATAFRIYVNRQFESISETVATKDDLYELEYRLRREMATKKDVRDLELKMVTKDDFKELKEIIVKIAEKVGTAR